MAPAIMPWTWFSRSFYKVGYLFIKFLKDWFWIIYSGVEFVPLLWTILQTSFKTFVTSSPLRLIAGQYVLPKKLSSKKTSTSSITRIVRFYLVKSFFCNAVKVLPKDFIKASNNPSWESIILSIYFFKFLPLLRISSHN